MFIETVVQLGCQTVPGALSEKRRPTVLISYPPTMSHCGAPSVGMWIGSSPPKDLVESDDGPSLSSLEPSSRRPSS